MVRDIHLFLILNCLIVWMIDRVSGSFNMATFWSKYMVQIVNLIITFSFLITFESSWCEIRGWLGVNNQLSIYLSLVLPMLLLLLFFVTRPDINLREWQGVIRMKHRSIYPFVTFMFSLLSRFKFESTEILPLRELKLAFIVKLSSDLW